LGVVAFLSNTAVASGTMSFFSCSSVIFLSGLGIEDAWDLRVGGFVRTTS
jgi:hypothetical protein